MIETPEADTTFLTMSKINGINYCDRKPHNRQITPKAQTRDSEYPALGVHQYE